MMELRDIDMESGNRRSRSVFDATLNSHLQLGTSIKPYTRSWNHVLFAVVEGCTEIFAHMRFGNRICKHLLTKARSCETDTSCYHSKFLKINSKLRHTKRLDE